MTGVSRLRRAGAATAILAAIGWAGACARHSRPGSPSEASAPPSADLLAPFASEKELDAYLGRIVDARTRQRRKMFEEMKALGYTGDAFPELTETVAVAAESVTNTQHDGVDEGGIVKRSGEFLVILRRGRLFTVRVGRGELQPVAAVDAFGPGLDPSDAWYDELLVSESTIVVVGYSYDRGGTEVGLFDLSAKGRIRHRGTYHFRSEDYFSARNYASRLHGQKLVFYIPSSLDPTRADLRHGFPAVRKWRSGLGRKDGFRVMVSAGRIFRPLGDLEYPTLHSVVICDLASPALACEATGFIGPLGRVFYVSPQAVYVWTTDWVDGQPAPSLLYRMSLDGSGLGAVRVSGSPVDQFSFLEKGGHLNVIVRSNAEGDGTWAAQVAEGDVSLLRLPMEAFSARGEDAPVYSYRPLPNPGNGWGFQNRFVGDYALYGTGSWLPEGSRTDGRLFATQYAGDLAATALELGHGVDRIEPLGRGALVVGSDGANLRLTTIGLEANPEVVASVAKPDATQGEDRSHAFFYKPEGPTEGLLGLPVLSVHQDRSDVRFDEAPASIAFLRNRDLRLEALGELSARPGRPRDDACRASCVDWYGNARPLFFEGRILGLLGYELVEAQLADDRLFETRRVSFSP